ncbi:MAG: TonB-dependent receptor, partial [Pseudomonadota bacterium]
MAVSILTTGTARAQDVGAGDRPAAPSETTTENASPSEAEKAATPTTTETETIAPPEQDESSAASQVASFAVTQLKDSPAVVTVISGEDIRASGARDLVDILQMVPGYFMGVDTLGVVGPGFRGLWGYEGKILLMMDGKEMNELLFSTVQLGNEFPVELIERVEVVRGPGSVIYGGNAELSVINVVTRGLQGGTDLTVAGTYGQLPGANAFGSGYGRRRLSFSGRYVVDAVPGLSTFVGASIGQGQRSVRTFNANDGGSASQEGNSDLNPAVVQLGVGYKDVQATFLYHHLASTTIAGAGSVLPAADPISYDSFNGELSGTFRPNNRLEIVPRFNVTYQVPWRAPVMDENYYDKSARRIRGRLLARWAALDQLQVTAGGDATFDHAALRAPAVMDTLQAPFRTSMTDTIDYQTFAGYVELYSENPIVNVAAGFRYDHMSSVGGALVPRLVLLRSLGVVSLKALFSMSFRAPGIENLNLGTDDMRPEKTRVFEFEGAVDLTPQQRLSANVFDMAIDAPIAYSVTAGETYVNLGKQGTRGFEVAYRLRYPQFRADANYSFYVPSVANDTATYDVPGYNGQFLGAAAHRGSLRATVRPMDLVGITPSVIIIGPHYTVGAPDPTGAATAVERPGQAVANLFIYRDNVE